jgi:hypothetical protein
MSNDIQDLPMVAIGNRNQTNPGLVRSLVSMSEPNPIISSSNIAYFICLVRQPKNSLPLRCWFKAKVHAFSVHNQSQNPDPALQVHS